VPRPSKPPAVFLWQHFRQGWQILLRYECRLRVYYLVQVIRSETVLMIASLLPSVQGSYDDLPRGFALGF
jgi:hypothetical protein